MKFRSIIILLLLSVTLSAQQNDSQRLSFLLGGGLQTIQYNPTNGSSSLSLGGNLNINYSYYFTSHWGLVTGLGINYYTGKGTLNNMTEVTAFDAERQEDFLFRTYISHWAEKQSLVNIDIPIGATFKAAINKQWDFTTALGVRLAFPISSEYKVTDGQLETRGYYVSTNVEYSNLPQHGFTTYNHKDYNGNSSIRMIDVAPFIDLGFDYQLSTRSALYLGVYGSYGLLDITKNHEQLITPEKSYNNILESNEIDKAHLWTAGIKVGVSINWPGCKSKREQQAEINKATLEQEAPIETMQPQEVVKEPEAVIAEVAPLEQEIDIHQAEEQTVDSANRDEEPSVIDCSWVEIDKQLVFPVTFEFNKMTLSAEEEERIIAIGDYLQKLGITKIVITGHSDNVGPNWAKYQVGLKRAKAVKQVLEKSGCAHVTLITVSAADKQPIDTNETKEGRQHNRRADFVATK